MGATMINWRTDIKKAQDGKLHLLCNMNDPTKEVAVGKWLPLCGVFLIMYTDIQIQPTHWAEINLPGKETKENFIPKTGDEIHFTDGTIWYCGFHERFKNEVVFYLSSFEELKYMGYSNNYLLAYEVQSVVIDAIKGGAKIVRGVGLI